MSEEPEASAPRRPRRASDPATLPARLCALHFCLLGLAVLAADLVYWARAGEYVSPTRGALFVIQWLSLPGIALAGGAAMVATCARPRRWLAFVLSLAMLLVYAYAWGLAHDLLTMPYWPEEPTP